MKLALPLPPRLEHALSVVAFLVLACGAVLLHRTDLFVLQMLGSFAGLLAAVQLCAFLKRTYLFAGGTVSLRGNTIDVASLSQRVLPPLLVIILAVALMEPLLTGGS